MRSGHAINSRTQRCQMLRRSVARQCEEDFPIALQLIARDVFLGLKVSDSCRVTKQILLLKKYIT